MQACHTLSCLCVGQQEAQQRACATGAIQVLVRLLHRGANDVQAVQHISSVCHAVMVACGFPAVKVGLLGGSVLPRGLTLSCPVSHFCLAMHLQAVLTGRSAPCWFLTCRLTLQAITLPPDDQQVAASESAPPEAAEEQLPPLPAPLTLQQGHEHVLAAVEGISDRALKEPVALALFYVCCGSESSCQVLLDHCPTSCR